MKKRILPVEYERLRSLLREVQEHQDAQTQLEKSIRRLLGSTAKDDATANDYIFDMVYNDAELDETLQLIGVEVES